MDNEWERINEAVEVDKKMANDLLHCFERKKCVKSIERFTGGKSTTNYKVEIEGAKKPWVLRIYPENYKKFDRDRKIIGMVNQCIPVPDLYYYSEDSPLIEYPYAFFEYLEGMTLSEHIQKNHGVSKRLLEETGEKLALLHQKKFFEAGELDGDLNITDELPPILTWYDFFLNDRAGERLGIPKKNKLLNLLEAQKHLLKEMIHHNVLSHGDFRPTNIMVNGDKISGIFDWDFAFSAPNYFDIGQFIRYEEQINPEQGQIFISAYNRNSEFKVREDWVKLSRLMDLTNLLSFLNKENYPILFADMMKLIDKTLLLFQ